MIFSDRSGFNPVDKNEIVKQNFVEELNAQLDSLAGNDEAVLLMSEFKTWKTIVGLKLDGNIEIKIVNRMHSSIVYINSFPYNQSANGITTRSFIFTAAFFMAS